MAFDLDLFLHILFGENKTRFFFIFFFDFLQSNPK